MVTMAETSSLQMPDMQFDSSLGASKALVLNCSNPKGFLPVPTMGPLGVSLDRASLAQCRCPE